VTEKKKEKRVVGTPFKKGNTGRPKGTKNKTPHHTVRKNNDLEVEKVLKKYFNKTQEQLRELFESGKTKGLDAAIISILIKAITNGDHVRLNFLLDRYVGKMSNKLDVTNPDGSLKQNTVIMLPSNGREKKE